MDFKKKYDNLWRDSLNSKCFPTERESVKNLGHWRSRKTKNINFDPDIIPEIEISNHYYHNTILFVGMNPSGANIGFYNTNNQAHNSVLKYDGNGPYYKIMQKFANDCYGKKKEFAALDIFGIVQAKQKVIEEDFKQNPGNYKEMFDLFLKAIDDLKPEVIVVANAFVRKIMLREKPFKGNNFDTFYNHNCYYNLKENTIFGGYDLDINNNNKYHVYFSCMLSGGHLDSGNRENLIWLIKNSLKNGLGQKTRNVLSTCPPSLP